MRLLHKGVCVCVWGGRVTQLWEIIAISFERLEEGDIQARAKGSKRGPVCKISRPICPFFERANGLGVTSILGRTFCGLLGGDCSVNILIFLTFAKKISPQIRNLPFLLFVRTGSHLRTKYAIQPDSSTVLSCHTASTNANYLTAGDERCSFPLFPKVTKFVKKKSLIHIVRY